MSFQSHSPTSFRQLVGDHPADKGIEADALGLEQSDDLLESQSPVPIVHHQHGVNLIVLAFAGSRKLVRIYECPQPCCTYANAVQAEDSSDYAERE